MTYRSRPHLDVAKVAPCFAQFPHKCMPGTVVSCHRNGSKGMGWKRPDNEVAFMCFEAHRIIDQCIGMTGEFADAEWHRAYWASQEWAWSNGQFTVAGSGPRGTAPKVKTLSKSLPRVKPDWKPAA